jgi:hypothetical protein
MKKFRIFLLLAVFVAVLIPITASAGGVFYCSASVASGGNGTYAYPWACSTDDQLEYVVDDLICGDYYGGYLYQIFSTSYTYRVITWYGTDDCEVTYTAEYAGYPPYSGVEVPTPYIVGAAALVGAGMLAAGLIWRQKRTKA